MKPVDLIILAVIAVVLGVVLRYIHRARKRGIKCIGCPDGARCGGKCSGYSGNCCGSNTHADHDPTPHK